MEIGGAEALAAVRQPLTSSWALDPPFKGVDAGDTGGSQPVQFFQARERQASSRHDGASSSRMGPRGERSARSLQVEAAFAKAASQALATPSTASGSRASAPDSRHRRRLASDLDPGGLSAPRRGSTPARGSANVRSKLERSLRADGACYAVCMAGKIDLEALSTTLAPRPGEKVRRVIESSAPADSPSLGPAAEPAPHGLLAPLALSPLEPLEPQQSRAWWSWLRPAGSRPAPLGNPKKSKAEPGLMGAEFVKVYGTGENLVLHLKVFRGKDLFVFSFGCIVCWSFENRELAAAKEGIRPFLANPIPTEDIDEEILDFLIKRRRDDREEEDDDDEEDNEAEDDEEKAPQAIKQDQIILTTSSPLERLAHAYALAQSVRLGSFEIVVGRSIGATRSIPETMAATGEVQLDARELSKRIGGLLLLRCDVNLHTDILDTPDIFWDEERFEPHYVVCRGYLDIDKRVDILNQRLGVLKDLYDLLQNSLNVKHGNKLEWIVIILILVEVLLELLELLHDAWAG